MKNQRGDMELTFHIGIIALILLFLIGAIALNFYKAVATHRNETLAVSKSERITDKDGKGARYLVYTDKGVYENTDSLWNGKFNSSDMYNQIQVNKTYTCDVTGWRNGFFSWYPNLVRCEEA